MYSSRLEKLEIYTFKDLLYHIPSRYEDYSLISSIATAQQGELITIQGDITATKNSYTRSHKSIQKITIADSTGLIDLVWFNQPYIVKNFLVGDSLSVSGKVDLFSKKLTIISPEYEALNGPRIHTGRLVPVYPETHGISSKWLRRQISLLLPQIDKVDDLLPLSVIQENQFISLEIALKQIHFPDSLSSAQTARQRLSFDEVFFIQLLTQQRKKLWKTVKRGRRLMVTKKDMKIFLNKLPFTLTDSQLQAVTDILADMENEKPMNRMLQGDVGSGKTVIAATAMYVAFLNGYQSAIMAPTEILAQQHFKTLDTLLTPFGISVGLSTSGTKIDKTIQYDVLVGTHALVAKSINFEKLGFIAIDEQQRFGVAQRGILREKGDNPHVLTMTATPIPRTMALTLYGELDVSYLTEMPKGRKVIKTWLVPEEKRASSYEWMERQIRENDSQIFIICPFIEESENMATVKAAAIEYERLQREVFPNLRLGLLHGKMKAKEKDTVLTAFRNKEFSLLVATPVVEVGIDIPNATTIVIEGSERFGLAQLHQLRGRVGRGEKQSYCLLFTQTSSPQAIARLRAMETISSGAVLAEFDLTMRGPGDMYGLNQSGSRMLKIASFSDFNLLEKAKKSAEKISDNLSSFPELESVIKNQLLDTVTPD